MDLRLKDRTVLITGGASGIGAATAREFAREGCRVAIWDLASDTEAVASAWSSEFGILAAGFIVNVTHPESIQAALAGSETKLGPIDHFVHAAAIGSGKFGFPFLNLTAADWPRVLEVNIMGMVHCAHAIAPGMIERKSGTMTFLASVAGQIGSPTDPPYSASKAANINFAQCMAKDLAKHGVRVNSICPGMVKTPLNEAVWRSWHDSQPLDQRKSYEEWAFEKIRTVVPLGRWQTPEDIANMIVFLASDRASQVTGQTINVDGGFVMHW